MWRTLAASVRGSYHTKQAKGNEDALGLASTLSADLLLIVSDGAGSAPFASEGSQFLTRKALDLLAHYEMPSARFALECDAYALLFKLKQALTQFAEEQNRVSGDFAATFLAVMVGELYTLAIQVGDGAIIALDHANELTFLTQAFHGDYTSETVFLSSDSALVQASVGVYPSDRYKAFALLSDGLEPVALQGGKPFKDFFMPLFAFVQSEGSVSQKLSNLATFLDGEQMNARTHDDKTLILACNL
ncbi:MAG: protein phosphatase 2C domain-containing protein [Trueperaceae bacterium]|nr:protein phosphatase 2C domain-containing protein [Trueperaceae bacterium]